MNKLKSFLLWLSTPFQILLQRLGKQEAKIAPSDVDEIFALAEPGDILVSYESGRPTSKLIKGEYDHAAIFDDRLMIIDAVGDKFIKDPITGRKKNIGGVRENVAHKWLYQMDRVALIRPTLSADLRKRAGHNARAYIGIGYDYGFQIGSERIYCSELNYLCYLTEFKDFMKDEPDDKEILPQRYRDLCPAEFILIYESAQVHH